MSAEFRQRTPAEYLNILRRRKWLIILPVVAVVAASSYAIYKLPNIFRSSTLIVVKQSTLPTSVIPTSTEEALTRQLAGISQVVTSRSSLEPLVEKYQLYKAERLRGEPMESILLMVGSDIKVEVNTSRNDITTASTSASSIAIRVSRRQSRRNSPASTLTSSSRSSKTTLNQRFSSSTTRSNKPKESSTRSMAGG
jgi:uncharacterized protein involved in exopolysaccharide biosynthesis